MFGMKVRHAMLSMSLSCHFQCIFVFVCVHLHILTRTLHASTRYHHSYKVAPILSLRISTALYRIHTLSPLYLPHLLTYYHYVPLSDSSLLFLLVSLLLLPLSLFLILLFSCNKYDITPLATCTSQLLLVNKIYQCATEMIFKLS